MDIGIIGSGMVGTVLGAAFAARGHRVVLGSREPYRPELIAWRDAVGHLASTGTNREAASSGEIVVFCPRWTGARSALDLAGPENLSGKVVIDIMNPIGTDEQGRLILTVGCDTSAAEQLQSWVPEAKVVKALNYVGNASMVDPEFVNGPAAGFLCGDDADAKAVVADILRDFGWDPVDMGDLIAARGLEPMVLNWMAYGTSTGHWDHAFTVVRRA